MNTHTVTRVRHLAVILLSLLVGTAAPIAQAVVPPATITILAPKTGASLIAPGPLVIEAQAVDPLGDIRHLDFYANDQLIGSSDYLLKIAVIPGRPIPHRFEWASVPAGTWKILARGKDTAGQAVVSSPVVVTVTEPVPTQMVLVPKGAEWRWLYDGTDQQEAWRAPGFDASKWKTGKAELGFGEGDEATVIYAGKAPYPITAYFRTEFQVPADVAFSKLLLRLLRDDGAVVYLNGREVVRDNLPSGAIKYGTFASAATEASAFREHSLASSNLVTGRNVLAVEVHQYAVTSSDLSFNLELDGIYPPATVPPVVSLEATAPATAEPSPTIRVIPGEFTVRRTGDTTSALTVFLAYGGTAEPGLDYEKLPATVVIPAGKSSVALSVQAVDDDLVEKDETVVAKLQPSPVVSPAGGIGMGMMGSYAINEKLASAEVVIHDTDQSPVPGTRLVITTPAAGTEFRFGAIIPVTVKATRADGIVEMVQLLDGDQVIDTPDLTILLNPVPGQATEHTFLWRNAPIGAHKLIARAKDPVSASGYVTSEPVPIQVVSAKVPTLTLLEPVSGSAFPAGTTIHLRAVATDPKGYVSRVAFFDSDKAIGVSEITFIRAPDPGTPIEHNFDWKGATSGEHKLIASAVSSVGTVMASEPVVIKVLPEVVQVVVEVTAPTPEATEPATGVSAKNGMFLVKRAGGAKDVAVTVAYQLSGEAANGVDYAKLTGEVVLPKNRDSVEIPVRPLADALKEGDEKVILTLREQVCVAIYPPPADCYRLGTQREAAVVIHDGVPANQAPKVAVTAPANGSVFTTGETISLKAEASDADGTIARLDLLVDGKVLGSTKLGTLQVDWKDAAKGTHRVTARAADDLGKETTSSTVKVYVRNIADLAFVQRDLPLAYLPGNALEVVLDAEPPRTAKLWLVEEMLPAGWTAAEISHDGVFDKTAGRVRFGPYTDAKSRKLTYKATPPSDAKGTVKFAGTSSLDGRTLPVLGDETIGTASEFHPADATPADHVISSDELTAYAVAWIQGKPWGADGATIPLGYVTQAGLIWRSGGKYVYNPAKGAPPACWVPASAAAPALAGPTEPASLADLAERQLPGKWTPGVAGSVTLTVHPPTGAQALAVEDCVPAGWTVTRVSEGGTVDAATGRVRWGLMFGDSARQVDYDVAPPADAASNGRFAGVVSCDGRRGPIGGGAAAGASDAATALRIANSRRGEHGHVHFNVEAPADQVFVVEGSADLVTWTEVQACVQTGEELDVNDPAADAGAVRYYRLRPVGR